MVNSDLLRKIAWYLVVIGGLNWGLVGLFRLNLVGAILGGETGLIARLVFIIVGIAAGFLLYVEFWPKKTPS